MWIKEQESIFCSEFTAKSFYLSTLPSKAWFRRQHLTGDNILHRCAEHRGRKNPSLTTTTALAKPNILSRQTKPPSWHPRDVSKCKHWPQQQHFTKGQQTPLAAAAPQLLYKLLVLQPGHSEPCSLQWLFHGSAFVTLPSPASSWGSHLPYAVRQVLR